MELVSSGSLPALTGSAAKEPCDGLPKTNAALSCEGGFKSAAEAVGIFEGETDCRPGRIRDIFDARGISLAIRFDGTACARLGVWADSAPVAAEWAVENTGDLCSGTFELTVNRGDADNANTVTARIINLKGVYGSTGDWFQHHSRDVETIFLSGIDVDGSSTAEFSAIGGTASASEVRFGSRAGGAEAGGLGGTGAISGRFEANGHSEGPLGVLGTWSIAETAANGPDFKGSSGADLKP